MPSTERNENVEAGLILLGNGRHDIAERFLREGLAVDPDNAEAHSALAACVSVRGAHADAIAEATEGVRLAPDDAWAHAVVSEVHGEAGHWKEALEASKEALRLAPWSPDYHATLAHALMQTGALREALDTAEAGLRLAPRSFSLLNERGLALMEMGRLADAKAAIEAALSSDPESSMLHSNLGVALMRRGMRAEAKAVYREALRLDPTNRLAEQNLRRASGALWVFGTHHGAKALKLGVYGGLGLFFAAIAAMGLAIVAAIGLSGFVWPGFWSLIVLVVAVIFAGPLGGLDVVAKPNGNLIDALARKLGEGIFFVGIFGPVLAGLVIGEAASFAAGTTLGGSVLVASIEPWSFRKYAAVFLALSTVGIGILRHSIDNADLWLWLSTIPNFAILIGSKSIEAPSAGGSPSEPAQPSPPLAHPGNRAR